MVAIIKTGSNLCNTLNYNENKLKQNVAELIHSVNYGKETGELGFTDKIKTLQKLTALNERTKHNSVHISLNFDPSEKIDKETLQKIADTYMRGIGFENQPYLVYQHNDAGHPHIHIVTTNIRGDGSRITMQNIGRNQSEKARLAIEKEFKLVQAQHHQQKQVYEIKPVNVQKVQYGKTETKRAITHVLDAILPSYKYASLPELNAVLKLYNIVADRGSENSRTYKNNGLVYRVLDKNGQKIGSPVKSSTIYNKPGLQFLNKKFAENEPLKQPHKRRLKNAIDFSFIKTHGQSLDQLVNTLQKEKIQLLLRQNEKGIIYGLTYVDHKSKCVFNGSELGKQYSANAIQQRCHQVQTNNQQQSQNQIFNQQVPGPGKTVFVPAILKDNNLLQELMQIENGQALAPELREEIRRRKRKKLRH